MDNLVFVDATVAGYETLIDAVNPKANADVIVFDSLQKITQTLANYTDVSSVHIVSHGTEGEVQLGSTTLNRETLGQYAQELESWANTLADDADILWYGCNIAGSSDGLAFVDSLSELTDADIAVSTDLTGADGDWDLEHSTGIIETASVFEPTALDFFDGNLYSFTRSSYTPFDVLDFTDLGYTYDYGYNDDFDTLPPSANTSGVSIRKNAADMTQSEINAFIDALLTLKNTMTVTDNGIEISIYDRFVAAHIALSDAIGRTGPDGNPLANLGHGSSAFLPWHRALIDEFENALQSVNPDVFLPYWDWTDLDSNMNVIFQDDFMGPDGTGGRRGQFVETGYFSLANGWGVRRDLSGARWSGVRNGTVSLQRNFGGRRGNATLGTLSDVNSLLNATSDYSGFRNVLETGMHGAAHIWVGGTAGNVAASPNDPIFWMLHANVDRIWAEWQINGRWGSDFYPASGEAYGHNLFDEMFPWDRGAVTISPDLADLIPDLPGSTVGNFVNGTNTINGNLSNDGGIVNPGNSPGRIKVKGDYIQGEDGELTIELMGGRARKKYDVLRVKGTAYLDGVLNLYFYDDFIPRNGKAFRFLRADDIVGDFDQINVFGLDRTLNLEFKIRNGNYILKAYRPGKQGSDKGEAYGGFASDRQALLDSTYNNSLYNPRFGHGLDHYIYGIGLHHGGWSPEEFEALFGDDLSGMDHMGHMNDMDDMDPHMGHMDGMDPHMGHMDGLVPGVDPDWYVPTDINEYRLFSDIVAGRVDPTLFLEEGFFDKYR